MRIWKIVSQIMFSVSAFAALWQVPNITKTDNQELAVFFGILAFIWYLMYIGARFLLGQGSTADPE